MKVFAASRKILIGSQHRLWHRPLEQTLTVYFSLSISRRQSTSFNDERLAVEVQQGADTQVEHQDGIDKNEPQVQRQGDASQSGKKLLKMLRQQAALENPKSRAPKPESLCTNVVDMVTKGFEICRSVLLYEINSYLVYDFTFSYHALRNITGVGPDFG